MNTAVKNIESARPLRELYFELGHALLDHRRHAEAAQAFEQAFKEEGGSPHDDDVLFNLALACEQGNQPDRAFRSYLEAIVAAPERIAEILPSVHKLLTPELATAQGEWLDSQWTTSVRKADLKPRPQADLARFLGRVSLYRCDYVRAAEWFEQALENDHDDARIFEGLGEAHWRIHNLPQALELLGHAHEIATKGKYKDRLMAIDAKLAQVLVAAGQYRPALDRIAESLLEGKRFEKELLVSRSQCYLALAQPKEALEAAKAARERDPESITAHLLAAQALIALGRCQDALKVIDEALEKDPLRADVLLYKAQALLESQIELRQGRTLLARYAKRAGDDAVKPNTLPPALAARKTNGNALYFVAELYRAVEFPEDALKVVDQALEAGLKAEGVEYPEAPAQQLKGELLEKKGKVEEAARFLYEAGRRFSWRGDYDAARELLNHSAKLNPERPATYWHWAEALRILSYQTSSREEEKKEAIEEAATVWDKSLTYGFPDANQSWAYVSRAWICEQQARLLATDERQQRSRWWEALAFVERALLLYEPDASAWSTLGSYHRFLLNESNALQATQRGWELNPDSLSVMEERAAILANVGELDEAEKVIDKRRKAAPSSWADGVKAYILAERRQYKEAFELITAVVEADPENLWSLDLKARCLLLLGDKPRALDDYRTIWGRYDPKNFDKQVGFGLAAYYLDDIDQAIKILTNYPDDSQANWYLGLCYLRQNKLDDGKRHLARSVDLTKNLREMDDTLVEDLPALAAASRNWPNAAQVPEILERIRKQAAARKAEFKRRSPEDELTTILDTLTRKKEVDAWMPISIYAGLGRLHSEAGRYAEATAAYRVLLKSRDNVPEVGVATRQVAAGYQAEGDRLLKSGDLAGASQQYRNGLDILSDDSLKGLKRQASLRGTLGFVFFLQSDRDNARSEFSQLLRLHRQLGSESRGYALAETCRQFLKDPKQFWALEDEWNTYAAAVTDQDLKTDLAEARRSLTAFVVDWLERPVHTKPESRIPVVTPVVMEIGEGLIPEDTSENWPLFKTYIPEMRARFEKEMGVRIPGVLVRASNDLPREGYALRIDEHWVAGGNTYLEMRYSPATLHALQALGIPDAGLNSARNPLTGGSGYWVAQKYWDMVSGHNLELLKEPLLYVIYHLEAVLRPNLAEFLGVQEVENMLEVWGKSSEEDSALIKKILPDESAHIRFSRLLRALVRDRVPIKEWKEIVLSAQASGLEDLEAAVRAARIRLKDQLPGNEAGMQRIELPAEWTSTTASWLKHSRSGCFFAPPPEQIHRFLLMLGDLFRFADRNAALVVDSAECRPHVRRLIESRFPHVMVLSREELLPQNKAAAPAAYA